MGFSESTAETIAEAEHLMRQSRIPFGNALRTMHSTWPGNAFHPQL
jgi:hypothetical protein